MWSAEITTTLTQNLSINDTVTKEQVEQLAADLGRSTASISAKLRKLGYQVASLAKNTGPVFSEDETKTLKAFLEGNSGILTADEVAAQFASGKFNVRQIRGKALALGLASAFKPNAVKEVITKYSEEETEVFVSLVNAGASVETIASKLGRENISIRGKALALLRAGKITAIPTQQHKAEVLDVIEQLLNDIGNLSVEELATQTGKTVRGIKTTLTRRGISCKDYDGAAKREKILNKG